MRNLVERSKPNGRAILMPIRWTEDRKAVMAMMEVAIRMLVWRVEVRMVFIFV